jgi:hypothetical protein
MKDSSQIFEGEDGVITLTTAVFADDTANMEGCNVNIKKERGELRKS